MSRIRRVIFDTSTLVSAALREGSIPQQALLKALQFCDLCASDETLIELRDVLRREKFDSYLDSEERQAFVDLIRRNVRLFLVDERDKALLSPACRDSRDDKFLVLALASGADTIVSSDADLLVMHPWREVQILKPAQFLAE